MRLWIGTSTFNLQILLLTQCAFRHQICTKLTKQVQLLDRFCTDPFCTSGMKISIVSEKLLDIAVINAPRLAASTVIYQTKPSTCRFYINWELIVLS